MWRHEPVSNRIAGRDLILRKFAFNCMDKEDWRWLVCRLLVIRQRRITRDETPGV